MLKTLQSIGELLLCLSFASIKLMHKKLLHVYETLKQFGQKTFTCHPGLTNPTAKEFVEATSAATARKSQSIMPINGASTGRPATRGAVAAICCPAVNISSPGTLRLLRPDASLKSNIKHALSTYIHWRQGMIYSLYMHTGCTAELYTMPTDDHVHEMQSLPHSNAALQICICMKHQN